MSDADDARRLTTELEIALLRELRASYHDLNAAYFKRGLRPAEIRLSDNARRLGQWDPEGRCIEMSASASGSMLGRRECRWWRSTARDQVRLMLVRSPSRFWSASVSCSRSP